MKGCALRLVITALLTCSLAFAQDSMKEDNTKADSSSKTVKITGKISDDGKSFTADKDSKSWTITNPEAVKGHEGHHVTLSAHVYAGKGEVHVMSMKMAKGNDKCPCGEGGSEGMRCPPCPQ